MTAGQRFIACTDHWSIFLSVVNMGYLLVCFPQVGKLSHDLMSFLTPQMLGCKCVLKFVPLVLNSSLCCHGNLEHDGHTEHLLHTNAIVCAVLVSLFLILVLVFWLVITGTIDVLHMANASTSITHWLESSIVLPLISLFCAIGLATSGKTIYSVIDSSVQGIKFVAKVFSMMANFLQQLWRLSFVGF